MLKRCGTYCILIIVLKMHGLYAANFTYSEGQQRAMIYIDGTEDNEQIPIADASHYIICADVRSEKKFGLTIHPSKKDLYAIFFAGNGNILALYKGPSSAVTEDILNKLLDPDAKAPKAAYVSLEKSAGTLDDALGSLSSSVVETLGTKKTVYWDKHRNPIGQVSGQLNVGRSKNILSRSKEGTGSIPVDAAEAKMVESMQKKSK